jgi:hypothetical protein
MRAGIAVSHERQLLGTAGGVTRASVLLGSGDVLVGERTQARAEPCAQDHRRMHAAAHVT